MCVDIRRQVVAGQALEHGVGRGMVRHLNQLLQQLLRMAALGTQRDGRQGEGWANGGGREGGRERGREERGR